MLRRTNAASTIRSEAQDPPLLIREDVDQAVWTLGNVPDALAHREWCLGVYAFFIGKAHEGRALVEAAAKAKPEYQEELKIFPEAGAAETVSSNQ